MDRLNLSSEKMAYRRNTPLKGYLQQLHDLGKFHPVIRRDNHANLFIPYKAHDLSQQMTEIYLGLKQGAEAHIQPHQRGEEVHHVVKHPQFRVCRAIGVTS